MSRFCSHYQPSKLAGIVVALLFFFQKPRKYFKLMHNIVDVNSTKGMSTHRILSSNDASWCVMCLTLIGNGFLEFTNNKSPGSTARGAGAPMITLREEETKPWFSAGLCRDSVTDRFSASHKEPEVL